MKTKLFLTLIFLFGISLLNAFSQEDSVEQANASFNDYTFEANGKSFKIKDAVFTTEGLFNSQATAFAANINGNKCIISSIKSSASEINSGIRFEDGNLLKLPMHVFITQNIDMLFFKNLNIINAIDVNFGDNLDENIKEGDEVFVFGNHLGKGTIEGRFTCIDIIGTREFTLKNFDTLVLHYENERNELNEKSSDLSLKEMELLEKGGTSVSSEMKKIKLNKLELIKRRTYVNSRINEIYNIRRKYGKMFSMSSLGSPVIHLKSGKCIGILSTSYNYKWDNMETGRGGRFDNESFDGGFYRISFCVKRFDALKNFYSVKSSELKEYIKTISESLVVYSYASLFVKQQKGKGGQVAKLSFPDMNYLEDLLLEKEFLKKLYQAQVKYENSISDRTSTDARMKNAANEYYSNLRSVVFGLRSRLKNSKVRIAFKNDVDTIMRRMESLEKDLDMVKRYN